MGPRLLRNNLKKKWVSHVIKKGKKHLIEKTIIKSLKQTQRQQQKNSNSITKLSIINLIPVFRIIELTNKKRRKKSTREIPSFFSNTKFRSSWGLKNLKNSTTYKVGKHENLLQKFSYRFLLATNLENDALELKINKQKQAINEKKYFRYYRW